MLESAVQQRIRLEGAQLDLMLWRNNSGACYDDTGRLIRYGLGNDSAEINKVIKSSDLIGITPVLVTQEMVGTIIGVFTAPECKSSDWHMTPADARAHAQLRFQEVVRRYGGYAGFVQCEADLRRIVGK